MIDGVRVTLTGEDLRRLLDSRAAEHRADAAAWERRRDRTAEDATEEALLPEQVCENEAEREEWRARLLTFLRDHLDPSEVYRLTMDDLEAVDLLPEKPDWLEQDEFERSVHSRLGLGPDARRICSSPDIVVITNPDARPK